MAQDQDTARWKAVISVNLTPVNKYGDRTGEGTLSYTAIVEGPLVEVVGRLERLKEPVCSP